MALPASPWLARLRTAIVAAPASLIAIRFPARFLRRPVRLVLLLAAILLIATALSTLALGSPAFFGGPGWSLTMITGAWHGGKSMLRLVDPLIGTANGGHVFPGATLPYGMAKPGPDTDSRGENAAGFVSDSNPIIGFSQLHDSGTGGAPSLGNFPLFVHPGCLDDQISRCNFSTQQRMLNRVNGSTEARPGYFALSLINGVRAEMTATARTSLFRFSIPSLDKIVYLENDTVVPNSPVLLVDVQDIAHSRSDGAVSVSPSGRITGHGRFRPSFGTGSFRAFFCADVRGGPIRDMGIFNDNKPLEDGSVRSVDKISGRSGGAWIRFKRGTEPLYVRVGMSFISEDQACANAEAEIPDFTSGPDAFDRVIARAEDVWVEKLGQVQVNTNGISHELQLVFWSGLYRTMLSPQNYTGENPLWESTEPYFDSFYCIWDSFRAQHPLLTILDPVAQTEMVRTLLDIYRHEGKLPDCRMSFSKGFTQGGSNADVVLADAHVKQITDGVDWNVAYEAVVSDAEESPPSFDVGGRGNIEAWQELGYVPVDDVDKKSRGRNTRSVSRTVEYAYDDFAIATLARGLGRGTEEYEKYRNRSGNWRNAWNTDQVDFLNDDDEKPHGYKQRSRFVGFPQPRLRNGSFNYQSTRRCSPAGDMHRCYLDTTESTYEGSPWLYSFYVPQDMAGLADVMGGRAELVARLQYFHETGIAYMGNEQSFLTVFQFHYGGRPGLSSRWARNYISSQFTASPEGLPGNDDCAMGAFTGMAMMGFFPVAGQDVYLLIAPFFTEVRIKTRSGRDAVIRKIGWRARDPEAIYIQRAFLNGRRLTSSWITHQFFMEGGLLELVVGKEEGGWGTEEADLPPSYPPTAVSP